MLSAKEKKKKFEGKIIPGIQGRRVSEFNLEFMEFNGILLEFMEFNGNI
jgi:hypothetical protein